MTSGGENFDKRCRDFVRRKDRGISEILVERRLKSPDRFSLTALLRRLFRLRGAYKPCRRLCARLCLVQGLRFPLKNHSRTHGLLGERVLDREPMHSHTRTHDLRYFREAGNKEKSPNHV